MSEVHNHKIEEPCTASCPAFSSFSGGAGRGMVLIHEQEKMSKIITIIPSPEVLGINPSCEMYDSEYGYCHAGNNEDNKAKCSKSSECDVKEIKIIYKTKEVSRV